MKIYKYVLETHQLMIFNMPEGATIVHCHEQGNKACMWALFDESAGVVERMFCVVVTGVEFDMKDYIGTCHLDNGKFVVHIIELK